MTNPSYEELEKANPEREIDDTNGWYVEHQVDALFWNGVTCKHATNVRKH